MKKILIPAVYSLLVVASIFALSFTNNKGKTFNSPASSPKIQVAILLDVSNSMDGLIDQAKAQLWNMVSVMGKAKCNGVEPQIEIALYEYGRTTNSKSAGYVKLISPFTRDLDKLSKHLFSLTTQGGDEYCGQVIYTSLKDLQWDDSRDNYKVIFIAGNEDFLQGNLLYTKACDEAKKKGVIVNTIYCGDRLQGIREHWNLNSECGDGSFTVINQQHKIEDIPTPYDSLIMVLNEKLNGTYIAYGATGASSFETQASVDKLNNNMSKSAAVKRTTVKGNSKLYNNSSWDLVDAYKGDVKVIETLDTKTLPAHLKNKSKEELKVIVKYMDTRRTVIQKEIATNNSKRETFIATAKSKSTTKNVATLETEIEKTIKLQAKKYKMVIQ